MKISKMQMVALVLIIVVSITGVGIYVSGWLRTEPERDTLVIGTTMPIDTFLLAPGSASMRHKIATLMWEGVTEIGNDSKIRLKLATDMDLSGDGLTYTFYLRQGVKFHDGTPFNSSAVKFLFDVLKNGTAEGKWGMSWVFWPDILEADPIEVVDLYTVKIHLKKPCAPFLSVLCNAWGPNNFVSPTSYQSLGENWGEGTNGAPGTGPWILKEWVREQRVVLVRNDNYWDQSKVPHLKTIVVNLFSDWGTLKMSLLAGEVDVIYEMAPMPTDVIELGKSSEVSVVRTEGQTMRVILMGMNGFPFNNTLLRKAVAYALNITKIIELCYKGTAVRPYSTIHTWMTEYYRRSYEKYERNVTKAKELLVEAGYPEGFSFRLIYCTTLYGPMEPEVAIVMKDNLAEVNITANLVGAEYARFREERNKVVGDAVLGGWIMNYPDPDNQISQYVTSTGYYGRMIGVGNQSWGAQATELASEGLVESDLEAREAIYNELQDLQAEELPVIVFAEMGRFVFVRNNVKNFWASPVGFTATTPEDFTKVRIED
jgi:peptide/nickel transport system substrate-binding protein